MVSNQYSSARVVNIDQGSVLTPAYNGVICTDKGSMQVPANPAAPLLYLTKASGREVDGEKVEGRERKRTKWRSIK
jgi:hypothetical protein